MSGGREEPVRVVASGLFIEMAGAWLASNPRYVSVLPPTSTKGAVARHIVIRSSDFNIILESSIWNR